MCADLDFCMRYVLKYISVKVFVTDGYAEKTAMGAKIIEYADRLGSLPLWGKTAFLFFDNNLNGEIYEKSSYFDGKRQRPSHC